MNLRRRTSLLFTSLPRAFHRLGFGVQSPWAYELVRDVLFEQLHYYAYEEQHITTPLARQLYRIQNHYSNNPLVIIADTGAEAMQKYEAVAACASDDTVLVVEHIHDENARLWRSIVADVRAIITFDMRKRGLVVFDRKRIKRNYLL